MLIPIMERTGVPRIGRVLDLVGLVLFVGGGAVFARAWIGFGGVRRYKPGPKAPLWSATHMANGFLRLQHVGVALMLSGLVVFVVAWWSAHRLSGATADRRASDGVGVSSTQGEPAE